MNCQPGFKYDEEKIRTDLVPTDVVEELTKVLTLGAKKYSDRNWEKGMRWGRPYAAALRHLFAWWRGEDYDPETGLSHLAHALCCVTFLLAYSLRKIGEDDRNKLNRTVEEIQSHSS